jgi:hypothetical protein
MNPSVRTRTDCGGGAAYTGPVEPSLVPLGRAVEMIAARLPRGRCDLQALACTVSALVPLYTLEGTTLREVREAELQGAIFRRNGTEIRFADGRPPITTLAVTGDAIVRVVEILQGAAIQVADPFFTRALG